MKLSFLYNIQTEPAIFSIFRVQYGHQYEYLIFLQSQIYLTGQQATGEARYCRYIRYDGNYTRQDYCG